MIKPPLDIKGAPYLVELSFKAEMETDYKLTVCAKPKAVHSLIFPFVEHLPLNNSIFSAIFIPKTQIATKNIHFFDRLNFNSCQKLLLLQARGGKGFM